MARTSVRSVLVLLALALTAGLGYRVIDNQQIAERTRARGADFDRAAEEALVALRELRASMYAYVAPGQGTPFWGGRADALLDTVRQKLVVLDTAATESGRSLLDAVNATDQLAAADKRARRYAERGESLLAGDVLFNEARDVLAELIAQVSSTRSAIAGTMNQRVASLQREQVSLAGATLAMWAVLALVFVPAGASANGRNPNQWRQDLAEAIKKPAPLVFDEISGVVRSAAPAAPTLPSPPPEPSEPMLPVSSVQAAAEVCSALSALSDPEALPRALSRASSIIDAKGLIVWVASSDGESLAPVAIHGYDERMLALIGHVARDSSNMTAAAFRDNSPKVSAATESAPAALAAPLCGPGGSVGVLSAEFRPGQDADPSRVALASIMAAQLATLALPAPEPAVAAEPRRAAI